MPNFAVIGQTVAEIWPFLDFLRWRPLENLTAHTLRRANMRHLPNFMQISQTIAKIKPLFDIQYGGCPPSWIFTSARFQLPIQRAICVTVPNLVQIVQGVVEIWPFSTFQNGGRPTSWIL